MGSPGPGTEAAIVAAIGSAVAASDLRRAFHLAGMALHQGIRHRVVFNARGLAFQASGRHMEALAEFKQAMVFSPRDPLLLNAMGLSHLALDQVVEARRAFDQALEIDPNVPHFHYRRGLALAHMGRHEEARTSYERAVELNPNYPEAVAALSAIAIRKNEREAARDLAERALTLKPNEANAIHALGMLDLAEKRFAEAEQRLRSLLNSRDVNPQARANIIGLLGDALEGQGKYEEAFTFYRLGNESLRKLNLPRFQNERGAETVHHLIRYFETTPAEQWRAPDAGGELPEGIAGHVFLLGFMRSGTTLLEQVLASNPGIVALEEKATLTPISESYMWSKEELDGLSRIGGEELARRQQQYWNVVDSFDLDLRSKIFVDKQPLNTIKLPLIAKLFPNAKIIFALRDPRDVVFSCYRRHFKVNVSMFEFLGLEDAARFYASIMRLAELYREKLPLDLMEHRYEAMVEDFEGRVRAVCDFIGVEWADTMRRFNELAPAVDLRSPSATQVRRPLYGEGIGQWRRYEKQLAPMFPILQPWVEKFGYPAE